MQESTSYLTSRVYGRPPENAASDAPILYFGRLSPEKGLTDLLLAMQRLPKVRLRSREKDLKGRNWKKWRLRWGWRTWNSQDSLRAAH